MRLESLKFTEYEGTDQEWALEGLSLGEKNLIVGKNASGKTRILNVINALAKYLAGLQAPSMSSNFDVKFSLDGKQLGYQMISQDGQIIKEIFMEGNNILLDRAEGGEGTIWAEEEKKNIRFQTSPTRLAAVDKQDAIQHKFLEPLNSWGSSLRHYAFGTPLGKDHFPIFVEKGGAKFDERDSNVVVALFKQAVKEYDEAFKRKVIDDMSLVGYEIEEISMKPPVSIRISGMPGEIIGLCVKEKGLPGITDQHSMSQGMFRALSVLIQINYSQMSKKATCILIDDIGEGLDFERSCSLIDVLRKKADESSIQLIMSTNDRFVMNNVPLEEWSVLQRHGGRVQVRNYKNSKDVFDEFKFTGLSNFSFLELDFISGSQSAEALAHG